MFQVHPQHAANDENLGSIGDSHFPSDPTELRQKRYPKSMYAFVQDSHNCDYEVQWSGVGYKRVLSRLNLNKVDHIFTTTHLHATLQKVVCSGLLAAFLKVVELLPVPR